MTQSIVSAETMARVDAYLSKPYTQRVVYDPRDNIWVARVDELEGCTAHGSTAEEAIAKLQDTMKDWLLDAIEDGEDIPLPHSEEPLPSGKWVQRVPRSLHLRLSRLAKQEDTSLNQFVLTILADAAGRAEERGYAAIATSQHRTMEPSLTLLYGTTERAKQQTHSIWHHLSSHQSEPSSEIIFDQHVASLVSTSSASDGVLRFPNGRIAISAKADNQSLAYQA